MADSVAVATTVNGQPAVQIKPTGVPEGNLGGAGKVNFVETPKEAKEVAKAINNGEVDPTQLQKSTPTEEQGKKLDKVA